MYDWVLILKLNYNYNKKLNFNNYIKENLR